MTRPRILAATPASITEAAALIRAGEVVAAPTETVYGLAGDATSDSAVAAIYAAKGRPSFNPLIVHVADMAMAERLADISPLARDLAARFWPGPLTLLLPVRADCGLSALVTAGLPTVALRMPPPCAMRDLIAASGVPLAAPSANASGGISPTSVAHVARSLGGRVPLILDGGATTEGLESTIVAPTAHALRLLRPGPVTREALEAATALPIIAGANDEIEAPGQLASHYAPSKPVRLNAEQAAEGEYLIGFGAMDCDANLSEQGDVTEAARHLFHALHIADASAHQSIAVAPIPNEGIGAAINDRLKRAAA